MPTRHSLRSNLSFLVALSSLTLVACVPEVGCPPGFALSAEGRCAGVDAGALLPTEAGMPDAEAPDAPDAGTITSDDACTPTVWYADADGDGFGDASIHSEACVQPPATATDNTDCADGDALRHPGADEICNGQDDDCDGTTDEGVTYPTLYADADHDGYGTGVAITTMCAASADFAAANGDCDDTNASVHPGVTETCDGIDNDCTGAADEGLTHTYYADCDADTFARAGAPMITACAAPTEVSGCTVVGVTHAWTVREPTGGNVDCDDLRADRRPDNHWYFDCDNDGFAPASAPTVSCAPPAIDRTACTYSGAQWILRAPAAGTTDCYDYEFNAHPGSTFVSATGYTPVGQPTQWDFNCDGVPTPELAAVQATPVCGMDRTTGECLHTTPSWSPRAPGCGNTGSTYTCVRVSGVCTPVTASLTERCY